MIFPLADDNTDRRRTPLLTWTLVAANIMVFIFVQGLGSNDQVIYSYATVPQEIVTNTDVVGSTGVITNPLTGEQTRVPPLGVTPVPIYLTLITSMFLHGGLAHILGNMLYLFIFGDNIEDRLGTVRFVIFYLACGVLAALAHVALTTATGANTYTPTIGASGAISGVLGGYLVLFPRKRVTVIFLRILMPMRAVGAIGIWIVYQLIMGFGVIGSPVEGGGVAYAAHIGGFIAGVVLVKLFDPGLADDS